MASRSRQELEPGDTRCDMQEQAQDTPGSVLQSQDRNMEHGTGIWTQVRDMVTEL